MENNKINIEVKETNENVKNEILSQKELDNKKKLTLENICHNNSLPTKNAHYKDKKTIQYKTSLVSIQEMPNEEDINIIITQTTYTREKAIEKLSEWDNNYMKVIKEYLNPNFQNKTNEKKLTNNQKIFSEIRTFMDSIKYKSTLQ